MIIRIWRGSASDDNAPQYRKHVTEKVFPSLSNIDGYQGANLLERKVDAGTEFLAITIWKSVEAIKAFAGSDIETAIVEPAAQTVLSEYDDFVRHYELTFGTGASIPLK